MQYIIYHDKSVAEVSDKVADAVWRKSCEGSKGVEINNKKYIFSSIAKILFEEDYYSQYPHKRPTEIRNQVEELYGDMESQQIRKPSKLAGKLMKQGFIQARMETGENKEVAEQKFKEYLNHK